jgi:surface protein
MKKIGVKKIIIIGIFVAVFALIGTSNNYASATDYTIQIKNSLTGDELSNHEFEFELRDAVTNELIQTKTSSEETITFDPIDGNFSRASIDFYKIIEKDLGENGMTYDNQIAYVGLHVNGKIAYQKDNTYKYLSKDGKPHPYHATDEELQGEAYAVHDHEKKTLTFFRDEAGKYTNNQTIDGKTYYANFELNPQSADFKYADDYNGLKFVEELIFKDSIRPEGEIDRWFYGYENMKRADISKFDTSRVTSFNGAFYQARNLTDIDITKLDFSNLGTRGTPLAYLFQASRIEEFDSRNYDLSKLSGRYATSGIFQLSTGLRYINLENWTTLSSSQEFGNCSCIEKLVIGNTEYAPTSTSFHYGVDPMMLRVEDGRLIDTSYRGFDNLIYNGQSISGTYIRPTCNITPVTFENSYKKPETIRPDTNEQSHDNPKIIKAVTVEESVENPNTAVSTPVFFFIIIGLLSIGIMSLGYIFLGFLK